MIAASTISGWPRRTPSSSGGAHWKPRTLMSSYRRETEKEGMGLALGERGEGGRGGTGSGRKKTHLFTINNIIQSCLPINIRNISRMKKPLCIPIPSVGFRVFKIPFDDRRTSHAEFASDIISRNILPVVIHQFDVQIWNRHTDTARLIMARIRMSRGNARRFRHAPDLGQRSSVGHESLQASLRAFVQRCSATLADFAGCETVFFR